MNLGQYIPITNLEILNGTLTIQPSHFKPKHVIQDSNLGGFNKHVHALSLKDKVYPTKVDLNQID